MVTENLRGADARIIMDRVIPFIRGAAGEGRPFFAVVWFHEPHLPVVAGPEYTAMYPDRSKYEQHYFGCITAMDEQAGRLRTELESLGVMEDTLLAFTSDNGPEGDERAPGSTGGLRGRKRSLFEGGIRVPGLVAWPGRIAPGRTGFPASTSDYLPTGRRKGARNLWLPRGDQRRGKSRERMCPNRGSAPAPRARSGTRRPPPLRRRRPQHTAS